MNVTQLITTIREEHTEDTVPCCVACGWNWPCLAVQAADRLERVCAELDDPEWRWWSAQRLAAHIERALADDQEAGR